MKGLSIAALGLIVACGGRPLAAAGEGARPDIVVFLADLARYHARPAEELYDLASDPHEQHNLAADPRHAAQLAALRAELETWMRAQGDRRAVLAEPRLLSDPGSSGPDAPPGDAPARQARDPEAARKDRP